MIKFLFLLPSAFAFQNLDFNGTWVGKGVISSPIVQNHKCSAVHQQIRQSYDRFVFVGGGMVCHPYKVTFKPFSLVVDRGDLYSNHQKIGEIRGNQIRIDYINAKGSRVMMSSIISGNQMSYSEQELDSRGQVTWSIQATLVRSQYRYFVP